MSNRAWMPLHITDYLADTGHLNAAEHGAYLMLIMHYWQNGSLPADERLLARLARMSKAEWDDSRDVLAMLFGPNWSHKRIDAELAKADEIIEKRRNAALGRHAKNKPDASAVHVQSKSTDTGVPPRTIEPSSSLRSDEIRERDARFLEFWSLYPHKVGKPDAKAKFVKALLAADFGTIMAGLQRYVAKTDDRPWCNPATWLHQQRWGDEPAQQPRASPPPQQAPQMADVFQFIGKNFPNDPGQEPDDSRSARQAISHLREVGSER